MYHVQPGVIGTASSESAGETLGVSREWGRGQLSPRGASKTLISQEQRKKEGGIATTGSGQ